MKYTRSSAVFFIGLLLCLGAFSARGGVALKPPGTVEGYLALLMVNEAPFPGERGWLSESDTKAAMSSILWVLHGRIHHIPAGYSQSQIAAVRSQNIIDIITVGGEKGQCDGFYTDASGNFKAVRRVHDRVAYLTKIANTGSPGKFARLMEYAQGVADAYVAGGIKEADRFASLSSVSGIPVTGRAYSWMTDKDYYRPGGNFVKIPNASSGSLGGNRFFTLKELN